MNYFTRRANTTTNLDKSKVNHKFFDYICGCKPNQTCRNVNKLIMASQIPLLAWPLAAAMFVGSLVFGTRKRRQRKSQQRAPAPAAANSRMGLELPDRWPFTRRRITGTAERELWQWLRQVFPDHHVLIKVPVARFLAPRDPEEARAWLRVLTGVYCTFAICTDDGHVIGCVDLVGPAGLPPGNLQIKQTLLAQCGVGYWSVSHDRPTNAASLRASFLGLERPHESGESQTGTDENPAFSKSLLVRQARHRLHETLDRNRFVRHSVQGELLENPLSDIIPPTIPAPLGKH